MEATLTLEQLLGFRAIVTEDYLEAADEEVLEVFNEVLQEMDPHEAEFFTTTLGSIGRGFLEAAPPMGGVRPGKHRARPNAGIRRRIPSAALLRALENTRVLRAIAAAMAGRRGRPRFRVGEHFVPTETFLAMVESFAGRAADGVLASERFRQAVHNWDELSEEDPNRRAQTLFQLLSEEEDLESDVYEPIVWSNLETMVWTSGPFESEASF